MLNTTKTESVAAFLARGGKVTKCPTRPARAKSLRSLQIDAEEQASRGEAPNVLARRGGEVVNPFRDAERRAEARRLAEASADYESGLRASEDFAEARAAGFTQAEALEYARG